MTYALPLACYAYDLLTGTPVGQIPLRSVQFSSQLNTAGQLTATLDLSDPRVQATSPLACTTPNRTLLVVDYRGALVWAGVVTTRNWSVASSATDTQRTLQVQASELWAYFSQRVQGTDYSAPPYSGINPGGMPLWLASLWDASLIACQILTDIRGVTNGNPLGGTGLLLNGATPNGLYPAASSGNWIAVNYPYTSMQTVGMIITQLSQLGLGVGFDFGVDCAYSSGPGSAPTATINVSYPRRGRLAAQSQLIADLQAARSYSFPEDGSQTANTVYEAGGSSAIVVDQNSTAISAGYPVWEKVISRANAQSANIISLLSQCGIADIILYTYAQVTPTITLDLFNPTVPIGSFIVGDDIRIVCPTIGADGQIYDPRFPAGLDQEWRITGYQATVADAGDSTLTLNLALPPLYLNPISPAI